MPRSLRRQLLGWVLLPLLGAVAVDTGLTYQSAWETASVVQDRLLLGSARMIAEQIHFEDGLYQHVIPPAALELFQSEDADRIFYRVSIDTGPLISGYSDLPVPARDSNNSSPQYFDATMRGMEVRVASIEQPVVGNPVARPALVLVAQTTNARNRLTHKLWLQSVVPQLLILLLTMVLIMFGLNRGLRPLRILRNAIHARKPGTLELVQSHGLPTELVPLVDSLNDYIRRLEEHAGVQEVFVQNAAHQLRTPFAVLGMQLSFAARASDASDRAESLTAARGTLRHAGRLVNQLLTLSSAQVLDQQGIEVNATSTPLLPIVQGVLETLAGLAQDKAIDIGMEVTGLAPSVAASSLVVREMLMNLVDNAIRYTSYGGRVTVHLASVDGYSKIIVEDNGPGIPVQSRERVFERFYRINNEDSQGSGLGLAIVRIYAAKIGAQVRLDSGPSDTGLRATVTFSHG